jgi:hypothetical protein
MLIFYCTDCNEQIDYPDNEGPDQTFSRLDEHIAKCPLATLTFEGTTQWAKDIAEGIRSVIQHERLKGNYTDHDAKKAKKIAAEP